MMACWEGKRDGRWTAAGELDVLTALCARPQTASCARALQVWAYKSYLWTDPGQVPDAKPEMMALRLPGCRGACTSRGAGRTCGSTWPKIWLAAGPEATAHRQHGSRAPAPPAACMGANPMGEEGCSQGAAGPNCRHPRHRGYSSTGRCAALPDAGSSVQQQDEAAGLAQSAFDAQHPLPPQPDAQVCRGAGPHGLRTLCLAPSCCVLTTIA